MKKTVRNIALVAKAETIAAQKIVRKAAKLAEDLGLQPITDEKTANLA